MLLLPSLYYFVLVFQYEHEFDGLHDLGNFLISLL